MLSVNSFIENVCSACNYPQGPLHTKKAGNCQALQISQLHVMRGRKCVFVRSQLFGAHLSEALRDRLVCGLQSKEIQKKLLTEEHNFDEALKNTSPCLSCGKSGHQQSQCKYRQYTCHSCGRSGHIAEACKSKSAKVHEVEEPEPPQGNSASDSMDPFSFSLYNLCTEKNGIEIPVQLNGVNLFMELDTGAGVSIISQETFNKHFKGTPIKPSSTHLHTYTGHPVQVTGQLHVHLKYQHQSATLPPLVVGGSGPSLFGRDWLTQVKLDWKKICSIRVSCSDLSEAVRSKLHTAIQSHPNVFQPGLGTIKGITAKLEMKQDAQPKFCKARPVPYALQEAVEAEYSHLESEGIVERVEFSDWAMPMVHVHVVIML